MGGYPLLRTHTAPNSLCAAVHPWPPCRHMHHHWAAVVLLKQYLYVSLGFHACGCVAVPWPHCWVVCVLKKPSPEGVMPGLCETVDTFSLTWVGHPLCGDDAVIPPPGGWWIMCGSSGCTSLVSPAPAWRDVAPVDTVGDPMGIFFIPVGANSGLQSPGAGGSGPCGPHRGSCDATGLQVNCAVFV